MTCPGSDPTPPGSTPVRLYRVHVSVLGSSSRRTPLAPSAPLAKQQLRAWCCLPLGCVCARGAGGGNTACTHITPPRHLSAPFPRPDPLASSALLAPVCSAARASAAPLSEVTLCRHPPVPACCVPKGSRAPQPRRVPCAATPGGPPEGEGGGGGVSPPTRFSSQREMPLNKTNYPSAAASPLRSTHSVPSTFPPQSSSLFHAAQSSHSLLTRFLLILPPLLLHSSSEHDDGHRVRAGRRR